MAFNDRRVTELEEKNKALEAEIKRLKTLAYRGAQFQAELAFARRDRARMREALEKFGRHAKPCPGRYRLGCVCGLDEALNKAYAGIICGLCGHDIAAQGCGVANADDTPLCHTDSHSCYHRWTVYGERPKVDAK